MSFQPVIPFGGIAGLAFLNRTRDTQEDAHAASAPIARATGHFRERIAGISTAEDLVADRMVLQVALGAFGLEDDINNRFFIEKILSDDLSSGDALANRLSDKRYLAMAQAFGFGTAGGPRTGDAGFADGIVAAFEARSFEAAVGEQDTDLRLVLGLERDLSEIADRPGLSDDGKWFSIMAAPPLRTVFETAFGLPQSFGTLDLDQQLVQFRDRAERYLGTSDVVELSGADQRAELERLFLARAQIAGGIGPGSGASTALTLLQSAAR